MKYLSILLVLILSACASTATSTQSKVENGYVRVLGTGKTMEEARLNGFQLAVEMAVGVVVVSEKQATNNILVRDQILKHSSGYVDDFKLIDQSQTSLGYSITMDVKVKKSLIADVVLSTGNKKGVLDSSRIYAQYGSYNKERDDAEKLIDNLLIEYPRSAFNSNVKSTKIKLNNERDMVIEVTAVMTWNPKWVDSLIENLNRVSDDSKNTHRQIVVWRKPRSSFSVFDEKIDLFINDEQIHKKTFESIFTTLYPVVEVVNAQGSSIIRGCGDYPNFNAIGKIDPFTVNASYTIPKNSKTFNDLKNMDHINVYMTSNRDVCLGKV
jgi:hypothetical protein